MAAITGTDDTQLSSEENDVITQVDDVMSIVEEFCRHKGVESHAFKIGWYNETVDKVFHLNFEPDTLAILLISTPSMFENLFKPFISSDDYNQSSKIDPLDQCLRGHFLAVREQFPSNHVEIIQDFELHPTRRPKILVQTVGHVTGAARYYRRSDVSPDPWSQEEKMYGVSVHPKYGGWFALRGVLIFKDVMAPDLVQGEPEDCVPTRDMRIDLLEKFNRSWRDWSYRDVSSFEIVEKYSEEQKTYFGTEPSKRFQVIDSMLTHTAY